MAQITIERTINNATWYRKKDDASYAPQKEYNQNIFLLQSDYEHGKDMSVQRIDRFKILAINVNVDWRGRRMTQDVAVYLPVSQSVVTSVSVCYNWSLKHML